MRFRARQVRDPLAQQNFEQIEGILPVTGAAAGAADLVATQGDLAALLAKPRKLKQWDGAHGSGTPAGSWLVESGTFGSIIPGQVASRAVSVFHYLAADWDIPGKTTEFAVRVYAARNAVAPGGRWIWGPWQITAFGQGAAGGMSMSAAGAFKAGPQVVQSSWTATSFSLWSSWDTAANFGWGNNETLGMGVNTSATTATNSYSSYTAELFVRWV